MMTAEASTEAAFVAGTLEAAARVWEETGVDTIEEEDFKEAEQSLRDRFGLDLWRVLGVQKEKAREARWRKTQRALAVRIEKITTPQFKVALTKEEKAVAAAAASLGAPGANDWLVTRPRSRRTTFENGEFNTLLRWRFRLPLAGEQQMCGYVKAACGTSCGAEVDLHADHSMGCCRSQIVSRHNIIRDMVATYAAEGGAVVRVEQKVECLRKCPVPRSDVRLVSPHLGHPLHLDFAVVHPFKLQPGGTYAAPTSALSVIASEENSKRMHYRPGPEGKAVWFKPWILTSYGRHSDVVTRQLKSLAKARGRRLALSLGVDPKDATRAVLSCWRTDLSCALMKGNAAILRASCTRQGEEEEGWLAAAAWGSAEEACACFAG